MPKLDRRVEKTLARIHDTFFEMLMDMNYSDISVSELTKRANIDRKTFYLHYRDKEDLLTKMVESHAQDLLERYRELRGNRSGIEALDAIGMAVKAEFPNVQDFHRRIAQTPSYHFVMNIELQTICDVIAAMIPELDPNSEDRPDPNVNLLRKFYVGGLLNVYWGWLRDGEPVSIDEMLDLALKSIAYGISGLERK